MTTYGDVESPRRIASRHNFDPAAAIEPRPVELHDLTLRALHAREQIAHLIRHVKANTGLKVEVHCHNDFGLAVANVLAAYRAGAGNASLESVAMALEVLYGVQTGLHLDLPRETCRMVEQMTGLTSQRLGASKGRPLKYREFLAVAEAIGGTEV